MSPVLFLAFAFVSMPVLTLAPSAAWVAAISGFFSGPQERRAMPERSRATAVRRRPASAPFSPRCRPTVGVDCGAVGVGLERGDIVDRAPPRRPRARRAAGRRAPARARSARPPRACPGGTRRRRRRSSDRSRTPARRCGSARSAATLSVCTRTSAKLEPNASSMRPRSEPPSACPRPSSPSVPDGIRGRAAGTATALEEEIHDGRCRSRDRA